MKYIFTLLISIAFLTITGISYAVPNEIIIIRHAEKPEIGNNLNCAGLQRSLKLVNWLDFNYPNISQIYVPSVKPNGEKTSHSRMFQTASPFAIAKNININSEYAGDDYKQVVKDASKKDGQVLIVWNHSEIKNLAIQFGVQLPVAEWSISDYDSVWVINVANKTLSTKQQNISVTSSCNFG